MDEDFVNPTWRSFEPSGFADEVNASACYVVCRVWFKYHSQEGKEQHQEATEPSCCVEWIVHFSGLVYLGEQIPKEGKKFKPNTLIFGTSEGYYGSPDCCLGLTHEYSVKEAIPVDPANVRISYSVNTVNRIQTVQRAIKQTQASAQRTCASIQERLLGSCKRQETLALREQLSLQSLILREELEGQRAALTQSCHRRDNALQRLREIKEQQSIQKEELCRERELLQEKRRLFYETRETYLKTSAQLSLRRKQHISDLSCIYPITKFTDKVCYSICGAHLPQSEELAGQDETMISVALGYVTHLLLMVSYFLNLPLRYPLRHFGSRSSIWDLVLEKVSEKEKEFPLFPRGKDRKHFLYAVYLLNKNIAQFRHLYGLSTHDPRMTLANLYSFIDLRFNIRSDPYSSLQVSSPLMPVGTGSQKNPSQLNHDSLQQVQIQSDAMQVINGSIELKIHQDMVADLTREIRSMTPGTPARGQQPSAVSGSSLAVAHQMSCSLDKGLNEICKLQRKLSRQQQQEDDDMLTTTTTTTSTSTCQLQRQALAFAQQQQHASFPNLMAMAVENDRRPPPSPLQPSSITLSKSLKMCSIDSTQNSDDDLLDHHQDNVGDNSVFLVKKDSQKSE